MGTYNGGTGTTITISGGNGGGTTFNGWEWDDFTPIKVDPNKKITVYHGTRLPMDVICKYGVPGMSHAERVLLLQELCKRIKKMYGSELGLGHVPEHGTPGVFVSDDFESVRDYAICAPSYLSDTIASYFSGVDGKLRDKAILKILDNIGSPKVLECSIPGRRFVEGVGGYGSVVDCISLGDIQKVYVFKYKTPRVDIEKLKAERVEKEQGIMGQSTRVLPYGPHLQTVRINGYYYNGTAGSIGSIEVEDEKEVQDNVPENRTGAMCGEA